MRRCLALLLLTAALALTGCGGDDDGDDVPEVKKPLPMDQVPAVVLEAAKKAAPGLTFYAAYSGTFQGKESIELKGRSKTGKPIEVEVAPDGTVLGTE